MTEQTGGTVEYVALIKQAIDAVDAAMKHGESKGRKREPVWLTLDDGCQSLHKALRLVEHTGRADG